MRTSEEISDELIRLFDNCQTYDDDRQTWLSEDYTEFKGKKWIPSDSVIDEINILQDALRQKVNKLETTEPVNQEYADKFEGMIAVAEDVINNLDKMKDVILKKGS